MVNAPFAVFPSILVSPAEDSNPFVRFGQDFSKNKSAGIRSALWLIAKKSSVLKERSLKNTRYGASADNGFHKTMN